MRSLGLAFALVLIVEGLLPLVCPNCWKDAFTRILALRNGQLRFFGLAAVLAGGVVLLLFYDGNS